MQLLGHEVVVQGKTQSPMTSGLKGLGKGGSNTKWDRKSGHEGYIECGVCAFAVGSGCVFFSAYRAWCFLGCLGFSPCH